MKQTTTGLFYLDWTFYISLLNVVTSFVVIIATFSLPGARLFFVQTFVGEFALAVVSFCWIYLTVHKTVAFAVLVHYVSMLVAIVLLGASIVALEEISTCYFAEYDAFKHMADCANLINRGTTTTFNVNSPRVCEGQSYDDSMLGMCVAAQVSVDYIEVARAVGVIASTMVLMQVVSLVIIAALYVMGLRSAFDEEARIESELRFASMVAAAQSKPQLLADFARVSEYLGKATKDQIENAAGKDSAPPPHTAQTHAAVFPPRPYQRSLVHHS